MEQLVGKTAVVTGAASGIGLGMTEALTARGMKVVMADIQEEMLATEAARLSRENRQVLPKVTDVSQQNGIDALLEAATNTFGNVHVLCNNAGVGNVQQLDRVEHRARWNTRFSDHALGLHFRLGTGPNGDQLVDLVFAFLAISRCGITFVAHQIFAADQFQMHLL